MPPTELDVLQQNLSELHKSVDIITERLSRTQARIHSIHVTLDQAATQLRSLEQAFQKVEKLVMDHHAPLVSAHDIHIAALRNHVHTDFGLSKPKQPDAEPAAAATWITRVDDALADTKKQLANLTAQLNARTETPTPPLDHEPGL